MKKIAFLTYIKAPEGTADDQILASALSRRGVEVVFLDWQNPNIHWNPEIPVLIRSPWNYYLYPSDFKAWLKRVTLAGVKLINSRDVILWNIDKLYLMELSDRGFPIVETIFLTEKSQLEPTLSKKPLDLKIILKPSLSAGSHHTFLTTRADWKEHEAEIDAIFADGHTLLVQPFLQSIKDDGEVSLIYWNTPEGPEFQHALVKTAKAEEAYRIQAMFGGTAETFVPPENLLKFSRRLFTHIPSSWVYARVDIADWKTTPKLGEIELIEPDLFFRTRPESAERFADILTAPSKNH